MLIQDYIQITIIFLIQSNFYEWIQPTLWMIDRVWSIPAIWINSMVISKLLGEYY